MYTTSMIFGIYTEILLKHQELIIKAAKRCKILFIAVSSDKEVEAVTKQMCKVSWNQRVKNVLDFCSQNKINAKALPEYETPKKSAINHPVDAYILSRDQYNRFGKELEGIIIENKLKGKIIVV